MAKQYTMNVSLTRELANYVRAKVKSGAYGSSSEVVREGLRKLQSEESDRSRAINAVREKVALGLAQAQNGQVIPAVKARARFQETLRRFGAPTRK